MRTNLSTLGHVCDKHGISDGSGTAIVSAVLKDVITAKEDPSKIF